MKKSIHKHRIPRFFTGIFLAVFFAVSLTACGRYPSSADDGAKWNREWEMLGTSFGVEAPGHGFTLLENASVLTTADTYYAAWTFGKSSPYINEDGKEVDLYPAQIYLLYYGCENEAAAGEAMKEWMDRERGSYRIREEKTVSYNGQEYTLLYYDCISESNPYERGVAAFGTFHHYVISAELSCTSGYEDDEIAVLEDFLQGCHFSSAAV